MTTEIVKRSNSTNARFSILVPSWNNLAYLKLCIHSILKNSTYEHQVIVHINEGKDGSLEWVKKQANIDYSYSKENIGVCYALNSCRTIVDTDYIVYLNDDMYVCPGWDKELMNEIGQVGHNDFFISSTAIEPSPHSNCAIRKNYGKDPSSFDEESLLREYASLEMHDWQGATWPPNVVHTRTWDLVGGYSTEFSPGMYSDPDFSMKLWKLGVRYFKGSSKSRAYHFGSVSTNKVRRNKGYYTFVAKWAITHNTFSKYFLRKGEKFDGYLQEPPIPLLKRLNNRYKQWRAIFSR
jgi:glycosyltransferase involved in cell wall biosynthesis